MNKHTNELLAMRDNELTSAYKKFLKEEFLKGGKINRRKVIERTITESRPHFHVSFEHAYKVLSTIRNHGTKNCFKLTLHQLMWQELLTLVEEELTSRPYLSMGHALSRVLAEKRASRFYLSHDYCYKRLYKIEN